MESSIDDYEKISKKASEKLQKIAKNSDSEVLKDIAKEKKYEADEERKINCKIAWQVFEESLDMYKEGEMTFDEMVEDLYKALKSVVK